MENAPFAYAGLDRLFHERARLGIITSLAGHDGGLAFAELKRLCGLTDGNLSRHLQVLEEAALIAIDKNQTRGRAVTTCRLTGEGRQRFLGYLTVLEGALREATRAASSDDTGAYLQKPI
jgi:DNA-binding MarR family transcriptional regulator